MTIEQTLTVDLAKPDPDSLEHKLHTVKLFPDRKPRMTPQEALARVQALCADVQFSVDDLLEERRRDLEREKE